MPTASFSAEAVLVDCEIVRLRKAQFLALSPADVRRLIGPSALDESLASTPLTGLAQSFELNETSQKPSLGPFVLDESRASTLQRELPIVQLSESSQPLLQAPFAQGESRASSPAAVLARSGELTEASPALVEKTLLKRRGGR